MPTQYRIEKDNIAATGWRYATAEGEREGSASAGFTRAAGGARDRRARALACAAASETALLILPRR